MAEPASKIGKKCVWCGEHFMVFACEYDRRKHCCKRCHALSSFGKSGYWNGKSRPKNKMGKAVFTMFKKGDKPWNTGKKWSIEIKTKFRNSSCGRWTGLKNPNWKGGVTVVNRGMRFSEEYRIWRRSVFERDNFTCTICGDCRGGNLNAHHVKSWSDFPSLRFDINNGRTLCLECHKKTNNYGFKTLLVNSEYASRSC